MQKVIYKQKLISLFSNKMLQFVKMPNNVSGYFSGDIVRKKVQNLVKKLKLWWHSNGNSTNLKKSVTKSLVGFIGGVLLTYIVFFIMISQLHIEPAKATWLCGFLIIVLPLGLAFSENFQCIILLLLPQLFSKRGRVMLITYLFAVTFAGPAANTIKNTEILSASLSCGQEQLKTALDGVLQTVKQPLVAIKIFVKQIMKNIEKVLHKIRKIMIRMTELITNILNTIKNAFNFLSKIVGICNKKLGTPFDRCVRTFQEASVDCKSQLGMMEVLCNVTYLIETICYSVKILDYVCVLVDFVSDAIVGVVMTNLQNFKDEIHKMFFVSVKFEHSFHFHTNASKTLEQIKSEIMDDVRERSSVFVTIFGWMSGVSMVFFVWMLFKIFRYKSKFLTNDRYDNYYITKEFLAIDQRRREIGLESALPFTQKERKKYIFLTSIYLIKSERKKIYRSSVFLIVSSLQIIGILIIDYSFFWILATVRMIGRKQGGMEIPALFTVETSGQGIIAELYEGIASALSPFTEGYNIDPIPCLPTPSPPNFDRYFQIAFCLAFCWILLIFEPYALRLRQLVMNSFYPDRASERAAWLYNNLLETRGSFVKYARRLVRRKLLKDPSRVETIQFFTTIKAKLRQYKLIRMIFGDKKGQTFCTLCSEKLKNSSDILNCRQLTCSAKYCQQCYDELKNSCPVCMSPIDYGDLSDVTEELGSSDDESEDDNLSLNPTADKLICVKDPESGREFFFEILDDSQNSNISKMDNYDESKDSLLNVNEKEKLQ